MYSFNDLWFFIIGVAPFGYLRIVAYLQLPAAFRSLSRPSSAPDAKAFTLCSFSLELLRCSRTYSLLFLELLEFLKQISWDLFAVQKVFSLSSRCFHLSVKLLHFRAYPLLLGKTYTNLFFINICPLLSVRLLFASLSIYSIFNERQYLPFGKPSLASTHTKVFCFSLFYLSSVSPLPLEHIFYALVGTSGLEPPTSRLSGARSNHLSYAPLWFLSGPFLHLCLSLPPRNGNWWRWW